MIKKFWFNHIWLFGRHDLNQNGPHGALKTLDVNFSIKYTLFEFIFLQKIVKNIQNWSILGRLACRHPICFKRPALLGPKYMRWQFYAKNVFPLNWDFVNRKLLKNCQIGPFWANWQTPFCQNGPQHGAPNTGDGNFFIKLTLF